MKKSSVNNPERVLIVIGLILILGGIGWVMNLIKLVGCDFESPYKCEVIHVVGIVPPIGAITGWLDVGK